MSWGQPSVFARFIPSVFAYTDLAEVLQKMLLKIVVVISRFILRLIARVEIINLEAVPREGGVIIVTNHLGRLDAMLGVLLLERTGRNDLILMIAEKYQKYAIWRWFARQLDAIWLNRFEVDLRAMRLVYKRIKRGELLAMAPEGTRSQTQALAVGKPGAAFLAFKTGAPLLPVGVIGTEDKVVLSKLKRLRRLDITLRVGELIWLPPINGKNRDEFLQEQTEEIMCQIAALLPPKNRGYYADHPRLLVMLEERERMTSGRQLPVDS
jgi:1-acyl-sn-glycerol-3-phosphate acyltransferase